MSEISQLSTTKQAVANADVALVATDPASQAIENLTAQFYNAVVHGCQLDPSTFQLFQGSKPLGDTSDVLWQIFDVMPPLSTNSHYNSSANIFSTNYGGVIMSLKPQGGTFVEDMGDSMSDWTAYLKTKPASPTDGSGLAGLFKTWADINLSDPDQANKCYMDIREAGEDAISVAKNAWLSASVPNPQNPKKATKAYTATMATVKAKIDSAPGHQVTMDSEQDSSSLNHSWANSSSDGFLGFFGSSSHSDSLNIAMASASFKIDVSYDNLMTMPGVPLYQPSQDKDLSEYVPWYNSEALGMAFHTQDNTLWGNDPTWESTFGGAGNLQRRTTELVVVDGITMTMSAQTSLSQSDQASFREASGGGFWPFYGSSSDSGWHHESKIDANGLVTITSSCKKGNPVVLGVNVESISKQFAN